LASKHTLNLAQAWLGSTGQYNTYYPMFTDLSAVDRFAIVTDHHNSSITKNTHQHQTPKNITYQKQPSTIAVLPQTKMAVSEGGTMTLGSKRPLITAADSVPPASQTTTLTSQGREVTPATISEPSMAQSVDELKLPPRLNLHESRTTSIGMRQSVTTESTQTSTCCMGYKNKKIRVSFNHSLLICQPCHCFRS
jgi:hypothetical protein